MTYCHANGVPDRGQLRPARSRLFIMAAKKAVASLKAAGVVASAAEGAGSRWHGEGRGAGGRGGEAMEGESLILVLRILAGMRICK